jgi:uncharacterized protein (TIGR00725 family)
MEEIHSHSRPKFCVSGSADLAPFGPTVPEQAKALGREIAKAGAVITTGATTGFPYFAAVGAKEAGGFSVGFSPASSEREHLEVYKLPTGAMDVIVYTGFGYPGRDLFLTRASDAILIGCGRVGTIHEFTIAFEDGKPIGILEGEWQTDETLDLILTNAHRGRERIIFDSDPKRLVERVTEMVLADRVSRPLKSYIDQDGMPEPDTRAPADLIL